METSVSLWAVWSPHQKVPARVSPSPDHANLLIVIRYQRTASKRRIPRRIDRHLWQLYLFEPRRCKSPGRSRHLILDSEVSIVGLIEGYTASCHYGSSRRFCQPLLLCPGRQSVSSMSPTGSCISCIGVDQGRLIITTNLPPLGRASPIGIAIPGNKRAVSGYTSMCTRAAFTRETALPLIHPQVHDQKRPDDKPRMVQLTGAVIW